MFNTNSPLLSKSGLNVAECDALLAGHGKLDGLGQAFINAENTDGINAFWGMAQAIEETGWGTSAIARDFNNLFGITAYDANPYGDASHYNSPEDCVIYWGNFLKVNYLTPGGAYYVSPTPAGVARHYASDPNYAAQVVNIMNLLVSRVGGGAAAPSAPAAPTAPAAGSYVVQSGDNMSLIAQRHGLTLSQLESINPHAGHPAGNFGVIWPDDVLALNIPVPAAQPSEQYYTVKSGDALSLIAQNHGITEAEIQALNPQIANPNLIYPGESVRVK